MLIVNRKQLGPVPKGLIAGFIKLSYVTAYTIILHSFSRRCGRFENLTKWVVYPWRVFLLNISFEKATFSDGLRPLSYREDSS